MKKLLDHNPLTGESTVFESDGEKFRIAEYQNIQPIIDANRALAVNDGYAKRGIKDDWWHYASIPNVVALKWKNEKGVDVFDPSQRKAVFKLLNDPEYAYLKTTTLKHGG
jgi:hypothetical protein